MPRETISGIKYVLMDIDDTITTEGRLTAGAYSAMEALKESGRVVVPITGRPGGWCDHIARMWPVDAVVGENGAFYFRYDNAAKKMTRRYTRSVEQRREDAARLEKIKEAVLAEVPGAAVSADQQYRDADLAIDFCEDVKDLGLSGAEKIAGIFRRMEAVAKISSIHVNGWFGDHDKLSTTRLLFSEIFRVDLDAVKENVMFVGDSPNDAPMFGYFPNSVGVANVLEFERVEFSRPAWITASKSGDGFSEAAAMLLNE